MGDETKKTAQTETVKASNMAALGRLAGALHDARQALGEIRFVSVPDEDLTEAVEEMATTLDELSDDAKPECSSGVLCAIYEAMKAAQS